MDFTIDEGTAKKPKDVIDIGDGNVEVRAHLADGRVACLTLPKGDLASYRSAVEAYISEHLAEPDAQVEEA